MDTFVSVIAMTWKLVLGLCAWNCASVVATRREDIIKGLLNGSVYDNSIPPNYEDNHPTSVTIQIFVLSFSSVKEASMVTYDTSGSSELPYSSPGQGAGNADFPSSTSTSGFDYSVTIFLREHWVDCRLKWDPSKFKLDKRNSSSNSGNNSSAPRASCEDKVTPTASQDGHSAAAGSNGSCCDAGVDDEEVLDRLEVDSKLLDMFWLPDLYFINDKEAIIHDVTMANRMLHIYRNGTIRTSSRISMTLSCDMYLDKYPHDEQICSMYLGSYSFSAENVVFRWHDNPVIIREGVTLPRFAVELGEIGGCDFKFDQGSMISGNYTCIRADFNLRREFGYYIAQVYVPSCLIVTLSWVSFWIDLEAIPARVSLGLLTVLTMTTQSTGEKSSLPKVSYIKAIDIWMAGCLVFVFAALLEFAYINVQSRVEKRRQSFMSRGDRMEGTLNGAGKLSGDVVTGSTLDEHEVEVTMKKQRVVKRQLFRREADGVQRARRADKIARVCFPLAFLIFNIIYWVIFVFAPN